MELCAEVHFNKCLKNQPVIEAIKKKKKGSETVFSLDSEIPGGDCQWRE